MSAAPSDALLQLAFYGECLDGHEVQAVQRAVAQGLKLSAPRSARLFSGRRVVLRRGLDVAKAHRHIARFAVMGAVLHAEPSRPRLAPAAEQAPTPRRAAARSHPRAPWWRPLRWAGEGLLLTVLGLLLGLLLGPGLNALWPDAEVPSSHAAPPARSGLPSSTDLPPPPGPTAMPGEGPAQASQAAHPSTPTRGPGPAAGPPPRVSYDAPQDMTPAAMAEHRQRYLASPKHKAFAITAGGVHGWHAGALSEDDARARALAACLVALGADEGSCRIVDVDGRWE